MGSVRRCLGTHFAHGRREARSLAFFLTLPRASPRARPSWPAWHCQPTLVARGPRPTSASPPHSAFRPHSALWAPRWTAPAVTTWAPAGRVGGVPRGGHTWRGAVPSLGLGPRARPFTFYNAGQGMPSTSLTRPASGHDQRQAPAVGGALKKRRQLVKNAARVEKKGSHVARPRGEGEARA